MHLASQKIRQRLSRIVHEIINSEEQSPIDIELLKQRYEFKDDLDKSRELAIYYTTSSQPNYPTWQATGASFPLSLPRDRRIIGGDGWAYDIGFGGLITLLPLVRMSIFWYSRYRSVLQYWRTKL